jgi:N-acetylglucosaminyldiphosphoundecaprenol N-acetyl-beta-D-mannosaminyltransferase
MRAFRGVMKPPNLSPIVKSRVGHFALSGILVFRWYLPVQDNFRKILGVRFYISDLAGLLELVDGGGLIVVPSAPVMTRLEEDPAHLEALEGADFAITDSGFMVLLWLLRTGERVKRISGLRLLRGLFAQGGFRGRGQTFWVMPSSGDAQANLAWLRGQGFEVSDDDSYVAPLYPREGPISDGELLGRIQARRPRLVVIALSGGVQERLGWSLRSSLDFKPTILCIGGAIAFLSGRQTNIPVWADRLALGWIFRFIASPRAFAAKVRGVERLAPMIWKYGSASVRRG